MDTDFIKEFLQVGLIVLVVTAILTGLIMVALAPLAYKTCMAQTSQIGYPVQWGFWSGCRIEITPGHWLPLDNYIVNQPHQ